MKVIFLDFDGVLNTDKYVAACGRVGMIIDPEKMELLKEIVERTGAKIVLSTSWREHWSEHELECDETGDEIKRIFAFHGMRIYGKTPEISFRREKEIEKWLDDHPSTENFVVLDDLPLDTSGRLGGHFVKTSAYSTGLTCEHVESAVGLLSTGEIYEI